ncbi:MAG: MBL fold metallo-hydrolase [Sphingobacteriales bacterium]
MNYKIIPLAFFLLFPVSLLAQQELQIHHINIENGDAEMIAIYDNSTHQYISKVLIDGGQTASGAMLLPYLKKVADNLHFNYVMLTHYHNDHYTGLLALGTGQITADSLVDPGGYDFRQYFPGQPNLASEPKPASMVVAGQWTSMIQSAMAHHYLGGRSEVLESFGTNSKQSSLGHKLVIGKVNGLPVTMECVAGWGNTLSNGAMVANPLPAKGNANNFSMAFILQCGEFRYFIGGDLGGSDKSLYIDQEDPLINYLSIDLPPVHTTSGAVAAAGHICGFKADHHGSSYANTVAFMNATHAAIIITSAGNNSGWHLPQVPFIDNLASVHPLSGNHGFYFTNLYDWGTNKNSLTEATTLFANKPGIGFDYGNPAGHKYSYVVRVKSDHLAEESDFEVDRVDISGATLYTPLGTFLCHKK